ncbi:MAG: hypothetical protein EPO58_06215 [Chitinophagaceae bacterium]|nr:MAG: hypothetical protein EPO58_06215 [Chitinophagaceae bacterium]
MRKIVTLMVVLAIALPALSQAQLEGTITTSSPESFLTYLRDRQKPALISKLKLTDEQAEKVIEVQVWVAPYLRKITFDMPEEQKKSTTVFLDEEKKKKYKAIPLSDEKVEEVIQFYANMLKNKSWPDGETSLLKQ